MAGTCNLLCEARDRRKRARRCAQLGCDCFIAWMMATLHGLTVMCQAIIYAVALNGSRNGLVALLIATQFSEIKGITYRKVDDSKLLHMVRMVRERVIPSLLFESASVRCCRLMLEYTMHTYSSGPNACIPCVLLRKCSLHVPLLYVGCRICRSASH